MFREQLAVQFSSSNGMADIWLKWVWHSSPFSFYNMFLLFMPWIVFDICKWCDFWLMVEWRYFIVSREFCFQYIFHGNTKDFLLIRDRRGDKSGNILTKSVKTTLEINLLSFNKFWKFRLEEISINQIKKIENCAATLIKFKIIDFLICAITVFIHIFWGLFYYSMF